MRLQNSLTHLKHQSNQNKNNQTKDNIRVILNEKLLAEERITLISPAKSHFTSSRRSAGLFFLQISNFHESLQTLVGALRMRFSHEPKLHACAVEVSKDWWTDQWMEN